MSLARADLRSALDIVHDIHAADSAHPFPLHVIERIAEVIGAHAAGYCETPRDRTCGGYAQVTRPLSPWLYPGLEQWGRQDPTHAAFHAESTSPLAISDFLSWRTFSRLEIYQHICRANHTADSFRVYLPPTSTTARFFFFDVQRRGFRAHQRALLELLRPHLALRRRRWESAIDPRLRGLTRREAQILEAVAVGATNGQVAERFSISPHTVRTHLEHIFEKLHVRTRTEAAAVLFRQTQ